MFKKMLRRINTRVFPRIKMYNFIKYRLDSESAADFTIADVKDISASGVLFISKKELSKDALMDLAINFPGLEPIYIKAQIVRISRLPSGEYTIGAHFIRIEESTKEELAKRINFILKKIAEKKHFFRRFKKYLGFRKD